MKKRKKNLLNTAMQRTPEEIWKAFKKLNKDWRMVQGVRAVLEFGSQHPCLVT